MQPEQRSQDPEPLELIGVYASKSQAESLCERVAATGGDAYVITPDDPEGDEVIRLALIAEQQEDLSASKASAQVGSAYPKEAAKGLVLAAPFTIGAAILLAVAAAVVLLPGQPLGVRVLIGVVVGAAGGTVMSLVVGPAVAAPRPGVPSAAQRGVVVWSRSWSPDAERLMARADPIRLDRRLADGVFESVTTEDRSAGTHVVDEIRRNTVEAPDAQNDWAQGGPDALPDRGADRRSS